MTISVLVAKEAPYQPWLARCFISPVNQSRLCLGPPVVVSRPGTERRSLQPSATNLALLISHKPGQAFSSCQRKDETTREKRRAQIRSLIQPILQGKHRWFGGWIAGG